MWWVPIALICLAVMVPLLMGAMAEAQERRRMLESALRRRVLDQLEGERPDPDMARRLELALWNNVTTHKS